MELQSKRGAQLPEKGWCPTCGRYHTEKNMETGLPEPAYLYQFSYQSQEATYASPRCSKCMDRELRWLEREKHISYCKKKSTRT